MRCFIFLWVCIMQKKMSMFNVTEIAIWNRHFCFSAVFLNRWAAAQYRVLASIILGHERFSWNLSF